MRRGGLTVSALDCVVFLGKTLYSHGASLHPGVEMGTGEFNAGGNHAMNLLPIQGGVDCGRLCLDWWSTN